MASHISLDLPEDPLEAAAYLEQELQQANDKLWALEDENRDLLSKLEFTRDNVKVLKRGYTEKIEDMQRKLDEKDRQLQELRQQVQQECNEQFKAKDFEIAELNSAINKLQSQMRLSEQPLTMQHLDECKAESNLSRHPTMTVGGLLASPAWGLFPGPVMSPIVAWTFGNGHPPVYSKADAITEISHDAR
jgi:DNA repair exonuclease SbcCD ATPase subunit